jgi:hypothetical protein
VVLTIQLEEKLSRMPMAGSPQPRMLTSAYREPLLRFLNKYICVLAGGGGRGSAGAGRSLTPTACASLIMSTSLWLCWTCQQQSPYINLIML